jgi:hypothetical protein
MTTFNVTVKETTSKGQTGFTGTVQIPGLQTTKLARKDGTTLFPTTSALKTVARSVAKRLQASVEYTEPVKKVAKKSVKSKTDCCKEACTSAS